MNIEVFLAWKFEHTMLVSFSAVRYVHWGIPELTFFFPGISDVTVFHTVKSRAIWDETRFIALFVFSSFSWAFWFIISLANIFTRVTGSRFSLTIHWIQFGFLVLYYHRRNVHRYQGTCVSNSHEHFFLLSLELQTHRLYPWKSSCPTIGCLSTFAWHQSDVVLAPTVLTSWQVSGWVFLDWSLSVMTSDALNSSSAVIVFKI